MSGKLSNRRKNYRSSAYQSKISVGIGRASLAERDTVAGAHGRYDVTIVRQRAKTKSSASRPLKYCGSREPRRSFTSSSTPLVAWSRSRHH
jgi:hypothetical protein